MDTLSKEFTKIGLNKNEQAVYLAVLNAGKISHQSVGKLTGINRTTVYSIARKLQAMRLITEDLGAKINYLIPEKPEAIQHIFQNEEMELADRKEAARELAEQLAVYAVGKNYSVPKIKFIEEADLNDYMRKQFSIWTENGKEHDGTWWGYHDHSFTEKYQEWIDWSWKKHPETQVKVFANDAYIDQQMVKKYPQRLVRTLPNAELFDSSLWIIGDYIIMVRSRERPHYLVEIYDAVLARNQRQLFKNLWNLADKNS